MSRPRRDETRGKPRRFRGRTLGLARILAFGVAVSCLTTGLSLRAHAADDTIGGTEDGATQDAATTRPGDAATALPGFVRLALPLAGRSAVGFGATLGYGFYEPVEPLTGGSHQLSSQVAASWSPVEFFSVRGQLSGAMQATDDTLLGSDTSLYGEPQLALRGQHPVGNQLHLGAEAEVRFIGAEAPSIDFSATTPTFRLLCAYSLQPETWLGLSLGFRVDNSARAVEFPRLLPVGDRFLLNASEFNALEWGVGVSHRIERTELLAEITADVLVGSGSPGFAQSPLSLTVGARHPLTRALELRGNLDVSTSGRPDPFLRSELVPMRPRFAVTVGLSFRPFVQSASRQEPALPPEPSTADPGPDDTGSAPSESEAPEAATSTVRGTVVDEGGRPLPDVLVRLTPPGAEPLETRTDANGGFSFREVPVGEAIIETQTPGYESQKETLEVGPGVTEVDREFVIYPAVPAGQLHGRVLDLHGNPVDATVTVSPGDVSVEVAEDGSFSVDLEPGRYTVRFSHPEHADQVRSIRIVERGVVVLDIALP